MKAINNIVVVFKNLVSCQGHPHHVLYFTLQLHWAWMNESNSPETGAFELSWIRSVRCQITRLLCLTSSIAWSEFSSSAWITQFEERIEGHKQAGFRKSCKHCKAPGCFNLWNEHSNPRAHKSQLHSRTDTLHSIASYTISYSSTTDNHVT
jgi:hypothetical protein